MTVLVPMRKDYFAEFAAREIAAYAHENVASFRWEETGADDRARAQFEALLPQGLETPGHHLCEILDRLGGTTIGSLWFALPTASPANCAYLYNLHVESDFRERHRRAALQLLETRCRELGAVSLSLHVFSHNTAAQVFYGAMGFNITGFAMFKRIDGP